MRSAVIVSTARTPIGRAYRGAFNNTTPQALAGHAIEHAVKRAGIDGAEVGACGNGTRCVARLIMEERGGSRASVETEAGVLAVTAGARGSCLWCRSTQRGQMSDLLGCGEARLDGEQG